MANKKRKKKKLQILNFVPIVLCLVGVVLLIALDCINVKYIGNITKAYSGIQVIFGYVLEETNVFIFEFNIVLCLTLVGILASGALPIFNKKILTLVGAVIGIVCTVLVFLTSILAITNLPQDSMTLASGPIICGICLILASLTNLYILYTNK